MITAKVGTGNGKRADHRSPPPPTFLPTSPLSPPSEPEEVFHVTRRRTNSLIRRPRHLGDRSRSSTPPPNGTGSGPSQATTTTKGSGKRVTSSSSASASSTATATLTPPTPPPSSAEIPPPPLPSHPHATRGIHAKPKQFMDDYYMMPIPPKSTSVTSATPIQPPPPLASGMTPSASRTSMTTTVLGRPPSSSSKKLHPSPSLSPLISSSSTPSSEPTMSHSGTGTSSIPNMMTNIATTTLGNGGGSSSSSNGSSSSGGMSIGDKRHPRELVPDNIGFPTPAMIGKIKRDDLDDKLLMATCAVLLTHENRALCPKEVAEIMFERGWLHNAGTTPFAHISTCIRSHLRRCTLSTPQYAPLVTSFELVGALTAYEMRAVGLRAEDRPAVKRGTLWYLDEQVLGKDCGAENPFIRCRREAGLSPTIPGDEVGLTGESYVRSLPPPLAFSTGYSVQGHQQQQTPHHSSFGNGDIDQNNNNNVEDENGNGGSGGMGRGKRKRRASSAAMAAGSLHPNSLPASLLANTLPPSFMTIPESSSLSTSFSASTNNNNSHLHHRRRHSMGSSLSSSAPATSSSFSFNHKNKNASTITHTNTTNSSTTTTTSSSSINIKGGVVPKLRLRLGLTSLQEHVGNMTNGNGSESGGVDEYSDGMTSDAQRRVKNKKKARKSQTLGSVRFSGTGGGSGGSGVIGDEEEEEEEMSTGANMNAGTSRVRGSGRGRGRGRGGRGVANVNGGSGTGRGRGRPRADGGIIANSKSEKMITSPHTSRAGSATGSEELDEDDHDQEDDDHDDDDEDEENEEDDDEEDLDPSLADSDEELDFTQRQMTTYSSASSSALLAQSLAAAASSTFSSSFSSTTPTHFERRRDGMDDVKGEGLTAAVSPNSLHILSSSLDSSTGLPTMMDHSDTQQPHPFGALLSGNGAFAAAVEHQYQPRQKGSRPKKKVGGTGSVGDERNSQEEDEDEDHEGSTLVNGRRAGEKPFGLAHLSISAPNLFSHFSTITRPKVQQSSSSIINSDHSSMKTTVNSFPHYQSTLQDHHRQQRQQAGHGTSRCTRFKNSSKRGVDHMEVDKEDDQEQVETDSAEEDDFHEAMLRGEDFDFEWGSESYTSHGSHGGSVDGGNTTTTTTPLGGHGTRLSGPLGKRLKHVKSDGSLSKLIKDDLGSEHIDHSDHQHRQPVHSIHNYHNDHNTDQGIDLDAAISTPATTPRSPTLGHSKDEDLTIEGDEAGGSLMELPKPTLGMGGASGASVVVNHGVVSGLPSTLLKRGMEATLCEAFAGGHGDGDGDHGSQTGDNAQSRGLSSSSSDSSSVIEGKGEQRVDAINGGKVRVTCMIDRATSTDSLTSLVDEMTDHEDIHEKTPLDAGRCRHHHDQSQQHHHHHHHDQHHHHQHHGVIADASTLSVPLPSPLALELPPLLALGNVYATDYDFVSHEDEKEEHSHSTLGTARDRDMAESTNDEEENDDDEEDDDDEAEDDDDENNEMERRSLEQDIEVDNDDEGMITVKIEEDNGSIEPSRQLLTSRKHLRQLQQQEHALRQLSGTAPVGTRSRTINPMDSFSRRLQAEVQSSSSSSSGSSDSGEAFDPIMVVSNKILASGLPIPQVAPSPPPAESTDEWGIMQLDLDDLEIELGSGVDLLGPESVGLEELDLAWGGPKEQREGETIEQWRARTSDAKNLSTAALSVAARATSRSSSAFLTGSPMDSFSPIVSLRRSVDDSAKVNGDVKIQSASSSSSSSLSPLNNEDGHPTTKRVQHSLPTRVVRSDSPSSSSISSSSSRSTGVASAHTSRAALHGSASTSVVVYPKIPLTPTITATIVQRGVAVYATNVIDVRHESKSYPLLRRIDTDYINGTVLLQGTGIEGKMEREAVLADISETFKVSSGGCSVEGTWIPLFSARRLAQQYPTLSHLATFLDDDLGSLFPEPIPTMRQGLRAALASSSSGGSSRGVAFGFPVFADTSPSAPVSPSLSGERSSMSPRSTTPATATMPAKANAAVATSARVRSVISSPPRTTPTPSDATSAPPAIKQPIAKEITGSSSVTLRSKSPKRHTSVAVISAISKDNLMLVDEEEEVGGDEDDDGVLRDAAVGIKEKVKPIHKHIKGKVHKKANSTPTASATVVDDQLQDDEPATPLSTSPSSPKGLRKSRRRSQVAK